ncbi:hypothetical protein DdX_14142 [Ditylenchus destructor]|uniref:Uncharacterized protein n=1 Tax=Ditylenchus destructor TaxID=166010 RepID=A0AAD4MUV9_9BILA|nr:hypothetical protein DdX_14142 [Ditylenchus destructor]
MLNQPNEKIDFYMELVNLVAAYFATMLLNTVIVTLRILPAEMTWRGYFWWGVFATLFVYIGQRYIIAPLLMVLGE